MNKEELLAEARKVDWAVSLADENGDIDRSLAIDVKNLINCINKLDEPQKPVIPQFVADYIETYKGRGFSLGAWFEFVNDEDEFENKTEEWLYSVDTQEEKLKREYLLIDATRYGYEVEKEKEKKYYVMNHKGATMLAKTPSGGIACSNCSDLTNVRDEYLERYQLTETEIKAVDERYWAFAEPVEEVAE